MPKITYTAAKGLVQEAGSGVQLANLPFSPVQNQTANFIVSQPGVYTMTGGAIITGSLPLASSFPGGLFVFRNGDAFANVLTSSVSEAQGSKVFVQGGQGGIQSSFIFNGSKIQLQAVVGGSVSLISDGRNYIVSPGSGSIAFSGT